jgi:peptide chain release factor subunit 3
MMVQALIETSAPICIERFEDYKMLGRFTIAIGKVVKLVERTEDMPDVAKLSVASS